jgi:hypothetical protein
MLAHPPERSTIQQVLLVAALLGPIVAAAPAWALRITEFMASNASTITDEDGAFSDWLELHNESGSAADLTGYYLTDDSGSLTKWQLPAVILPPDGYRLVFASNKNRTNPAGELHTNFALSAGGEYLALVADGMASSMPMRRVPPGGRYLLRLAGASRPSGASSIRARSRQRRARPADSTGTRRAARLYDAPFESALTITPGATIRYTTDGSEPTESQGTIYAGPIGVTTTTAIRAVAYKAGLSTSRSTTQTYIFLDDVVQQAQSTISPAFPSVWGAGIAADYDMDRTWSTVITRRPSATT